MAKTHGRSRTKEYRTWYDMHRRCKDKRHTYWHRYGGRGITVAPVWKDFETFHSDVGDAPTEKHQLDRIDNNQDYAPSNVRWATKLEQSRNTSTNVNLTYAGKTQTLKEWATEMGIPYSSMHWRYREGWALHEVIEGRPDLPRERKKACKRGHEMTEENTIWPRPDLRRCRICYLAWNRKRYWKAKGQEPPKKIRQSWKKLEREAYDALS